MVQGGRFAIAGPIVAAACVVPEHVVIEGMYGADKLTGPQRQALYDALTATPGVEIGIGLVLPAEIDGLGSPVKVSRCPTEKSLKVSCHER
jgi:ribonuclease HII